QGTPCRFQTCYPTILWPIEIVSASLESPTPTDTRGKWPEAVIKIGLRCLHGSKLSELKLGEGRQAHLIDCLRFYLNGETQLVYSLYEMIFNNAVGVELRPADAKKGLGALKASSSISLEPSALKAVGFEREEDMLPYTARSFAGYRLLTEYFAFPD